MRFLIILPLLGAIALASDLVGDKCQCPQVKCAGDNEAALCKCLNDNEARCAKKCPKYKPAYQSCPIPSPTPTPKPTSTRVSLPSAIATSKPVTCECEQVFCIKSYPEGCYCENDAKQRCYDTCGGPAPKLSSCAVEAVVARAPAPQDSPAPVVEAACECEEVFCIQSYPEGCYCANAAKEACAKKCGTVATLQSCPPLELSSSSKSLLTKIKPTPKPHKPTPIPPKFTPKSTPLPPKPTSTPLSPNPHQVCGGGRANYNLCDAGYTCIQDPYTPGCGPACDGLGICVREKMCGGFAGFACDEAGQVCHDDPRDECSVEGGGADCGGLCIWPHRSLYEV